MIFCLFALFFICIPSHFQTRVEITSQQRSRYVIIVTGTPCRKLYNLQLAKCKILVCLKILKRFLCFVTAYTSISSVLAATSKNTDESMKLEAMLQ